MLFISLLFYVHEWIILIKNTNTIMAPSVIPFMKFIKKQIKEILEI